MARNYSCFFEQTGCCSGITKAWGDGTYGELGGVRSLALLCNGKVYSLTPILLQIQILWAVHRCEAVMDFGGWPLTNRSFTDPQALPGPYRTLSPQWSSWVAFEVDADSI